MRILITGGTVVNVDGSIAADVLIDGETVAAVFNKTEHAHPGRAADQPPAGGAAGLSLDGAAAA